MPTQSSNTNRNRTLLILLGILLACLITLNASSYVATESVLQPQKDIAMPEKPASLNDHAKELSQTFVEGIAKKFSSL